MSSWVISRVGNVQVRIVRVGVVPVGNVQEGNARYTQTQTNSKNSLLVIGTKIHTLRNGESETQQGFIWLYTSNTSIDIWPLLLKEHNNG